MMVGRRCRLPLKNGHVATVELLLEKGAKGEPDALGEMPESYARR
jgi:hypothetical protein